ncbi:MAG: ATP-binding cassette domain-containing protein [candidate division NC10 bacterium]|nr:ATP-binding cassette domain-containing protein [candidate division NC10 bacterium]
MSPAPSAQETKDLCIEVRDLRRRYGGVEAVKGVSFSVARGEIFGLLGPDGAGKSTIIQTLCGLLSPSSGSVLVNGVDVLKAPERIRSHLGYMAQGLGLTLFDNLSVKEHLDFFGELHAVPPSRREQIKEELLRLTRLSPFQERLAKNLSGGMKQKLALCSALIHSPPLLFLDEPTTGVDPLSRRDFWIIINQLLKEKGVTILLTTSYMDEAERCHRVALLHEGEIIASGTPEELRGKAAIRSLELWARPEEAAERALLQRGWRVRRLRGRLVATAPQEVKGEWISAWMREAGAALMRMEARPPDLEDILLSLLERKRGEEKQPLQPRPPAQKVASREGPAISVQRLVKRFNGFAAVGGIDFQVERGEIFGFLGPNGAGKTTTIKILCGIIPPTEGGGTISGFDIVRQRYQIKSRIGYMSQKFSLYRDLSVSENLRLYGGIYQVDRKSFRAGQAWIMELADLRGREETLARDLPLGIRQRLALGCALIHKPEILFLDEPTAGVDLVARKRFWDLIWSLSREEGVTVLVTTHYLDEAEHCDRLGLIYDGRLVALGSPASLKEETAHRLGTPLYIDCQEPLRAWDLLRTQFPRIFLYGRRVRVFSLHPEEDALRVRRLLEEHGISIHRLQEEEVRLEDAFIQCIEWEEERGRGK